MLGLPLPSLDTLLSLPFFSVLLAPSVLSTTSLSTSLNLLLFYLTWTTIVWSYSPITISLVATFAVRIIFYFAPCALFIAFDTTVPSVSQSIKASGNRALPHRAAAAIAPRNVGSGPQKQAITVSKLFAVALFNITLSILLQVGIDYILTSLLHRKSALRVTASYPLPWSIAKDITRAYIVRNTLAYYVHRFALHFDQPRNRLRGVNILGASTLTTWHNQWHHSLGTSLPFAAAFDHPAPYLVGRWMPAYAPAFLFRMHMLSYLLFTALLGLEDALAHSGYTVLPSTILLQGAARRQEAHLESNGAGNYGPWGLLDWLHSTGVGGQDFVDDLKDEASKRDVRGKAEKARGELGSRVTEAGRRMMGGADGQAHEEAEDDEEPQRKASNGARKPRLRGAA